MFLWHLNLKNENWEMGKSHYVEGHMSVYIENGVESIIVRCQTVQGVVSGWWRVYILLSTFVYLHFLLEQVYKMQITLNAEKKG